VAAVSKQIRVLVVDDDALVRAGLAMLLAGAEGIAVVGEAADGSDVAQAVAEHEPDIVLMDIRMPGMDGLAATELVRAQADAPEVIVLTTFEADDYVLRALPPAPADSCSRTRRRPTSSAPCGPSPQATRCSHPRSPAG
jgi:DNA-binding NarL/FixJ family response regulator